MYHTINLLLFELIRLLKYITVTFLQKALCKSGTKILNIKFPLPAHHGWHPKATIECDDVVKIGSTARIYLYVVE